MSNLSKSIYRTLAFFDAQDLALTLLEIQSYLVGEKRWGVMDIQKTIERELAGKIAQQGGLYFLLGREELVPLRRAKYRISLQRFQKVQKYLRPLRFFPYLRVMAVSGSTALLNCTVDSDIDLFIVTKRNRIWITRALVSLYFQLLGVRRHGAWIAGRFCLNHYLADNAVIGEDQNLYTAVEYACLIPVLGDLHKFYYNNAWIGEYTGFVSGQETSPVLGMQFSKAQFFFEKILDYTAGPVLNFLFYKYQKHRIRLQSHILVSNTELSFHPGSRGQSVLASFRAKVGEF